ncbi:hypothetical protein EV651_102490 [Kribbella sp. VKM Ac-2571]|uniref:hypothetical protein n=1 Tax=Kribbella sp. VKM Ac-2571 TaxID=2512222 RepID=UPI00105B476F|nr:hypothetical protein [Kribbella sp. VKM Ac-2571]TDO68567.1 hypothetical protein EV651_102490 [Kribbella sp. VKM Ac-2571]
MAAVRRGAGVGQFLGFEDRLGHQDGPWSECARILWYVEVYGARPVKVSLCHKFDIGDGSFADLGEFPDVEEWDPIDDDGNYRGDDPSVRSFEEPEQALAWVENVHGASTSRWVNESMLGDEYLDALRLLG